MNQNEIRSELACQVGGEIDCAICTIGPIRSSDNATMARKRDTERARPIVTCNHQARTNPEALIQVKINVAGREMRSCQSTEIKASTALLHLSKHPPRDDVAALNIRSAEGSTLSPGGLMHINVD